MQSINLDSLRYGDIEALVNRLAPAGCVSEYVLESLALQLSCAITFRRDHASGDPARVRALEAAEDTLNALNRMLHGDFSEGHLKSVLTTCFLSGDSVEDVADRLGQRVELTELQKAFARSCLNLMEDVRAEEADQSHPGRYGAFVGAPANTAPVESASTSAGYTQRGGLI